MKIKQRSWYSAAALAVFFIIVVGLLWVNYLFAQQNTGGARFWVHYKSTRIFLLEGKSPLSEDVLDTVWENSSRPSIPVNEEAGVWASPLFSILIWAPFSLISNFQAARAVWMLVLEFSLLGTALLSFQVLKWNPRLWLQGSVLLFALLGVHALQGLINSGSEIFSALLVTAALLAMKNNQDQLAGLLLGVTMIEPRLTVGLIIFIMVWSLHQERYQIVFWYTASLLGLILGGAVLVPNWIIQYLRALLLFSESFSFYPLGEVITSWLPGIGLQLSWGAGIGLGILLLYEWWQCRETGWRGLLWGCALTMTITMWLTFYSDPAQFSHLLFAAVLVISALDNRYKERANLISSGFLLVLFLGAWGIYLLGLNGSASVVQQPLVLVFVPGLLLVFLYWIKWWYVLPTRDLWDLKT